LLVLLAVWLAVSSMLVLLALPNLSSPGLYYDEAVNGGLAKDFVTGRPQGWHMPGTEVIGLAGRPLPLFVQWYSGAVKPWLIVPSLVLFDSTTAVLRLTSLFWCLVGLLSCMLWTRKLLGLAAAILVAPILAFDPSFFFPCLVDWGPVVPGFLCRSAGFYFLLRWWNDEKGRDGFLGMLALGLGFFAKIDFLFIMLGCGIAAVIVHGRKIYAAFRGAPPNGLCAGWGFCWGLAPCF
jgi:4-amino-4-deoxy-L-arabinose transferase-like glycosyltransferase